LFSVSSSGTAPESFDASGYSELAGLAALRGDLAALHREIVEEAAHSMGSSARRLAASLEALERLDEELAHVDPADEARRRELVARFNAQREDALLRLHYVQIQREALGFTRHDELERHYPVPPKKPAP
jgi:hypothetical protein